MCDVCVCVYVCACVYDIVYWTWYTVSECCADTWGHVAAALARFQSYHLRFLALATTTPALRPGLSIGSHTAS